MTSRPCIYFQSPRMRRTYAIALIGFCFLAILWLLTRHNDFPAYYHNDDKPSDASYLDSLAAALEVSPEDMKTLRKEREEFQKSILALNEASSDADPPNPEGSRKPGGDHRTRQ